MCRANEQGEFVLGDAIPTSAASWVIDDEASRVAVQQITREVFALVAIETAARVEEDEVGSALAHLTDCHPGSSDVKDVVLCLTEQDEG